MSSRVLRTRLYEMRGAVRPHAVLLCVPVYAKGTSRDTVADRRRNLSGFVVGIFDLPPLLQSIRARTAASPAVGIEVYPPVAGDDTGAVEPRPLPDFSSGRQRVERPQPSWSATLRIGDSAWPVQASPVAGGPLITHHERAFAILAAGLIITTFLAVYLALASRNALQLSLANRRVLELAQTDILTGLPNRAYFLERLQRDHLRLPERRNVFGPAARSRSLQERQRLARSRGRRRAVAAGGGAPALDAGRHRRAGAARRRRVRDRPDRMRGSADRFVRSVAPDRETDRRAVPAVGPSRRDRHQHRDCDRARPRQRAGSSC